MPVSWLFIILRLYCIAKNIERGEPHNNKIKLGGTIAKSIMVIMITGVGSSLNLLTVCFIRALIKLTIVFRSHEAALSQGLLDGYKVHVTKKVLPDPSQMKGM